MILTYISFKCIVLPVTFCSFKENMKIRPLWLRRLCWWKPPLVHETTDRALEQLIHEINLACKARQDQQTQNVKAHAFRSQLKVLVSGVSCQITVNSYGVFISLWGVTQDRLDELEACLKFRNRQKGTNYQVSTERLK